MTISLPLAHAPYGYAAHDDLFGGNVLAPTRPLVGDGSYDEAIGDLGVTVLRYPGGSLTEYTFDWNNPDATQVTHSDTGATTEFIGFSDFMGYAAENGHKVTIVLPTRTQLSEHVDTAGNRLPDIDEEGLREFIHDAASGAFGEAQIAAFEIGNEYWGSGGMTAAEYGALASRMAVIISDELRLVGEVHGIDTGDTSVLVQMGQNYGTSRISNDYVGWDSHDVIDDLLLKYPGAELSYDNIRGNGDPNWSEINNELVRMAFETQEEIDAIDGIVAHVYTRGEGNENSRTYDLDIIERTWLEKEGFQHLETHVTEWNLKSTSGLDRNEDYGLHQAHEMLNIVEAFMEAGVDDAHVWPLIQNTSNALSIGMEHEALSAPGEMFAMMAQNLPGKVMIDFSPDGARDTEYEGETVDIHGFAGGGDVIFYIASTSSEAAVNDIDLSGFISGFGAMDVSILGVADGELPGSTRAVAAVRDMDSNEVYQDGILEADLAPGEIMQVVIRAVVPTDDFAPTLAAIDAMSIPDDLGDRDADNDGDNDPLDDLYRDDHEDNDPDDRTDEDDGGDDSGEGDDGSWSGLLIALAFLPLMAFAGL